MEEMELEIPIDFYYTALFYQIEQEKDIIRKSIERNLNSGILKKEMTKSQIIDWYLSIFFDCDFEVLCYELYEIAEECGIRIKRLF